MGLAGMARQSKPHPVSMIDVNTTNAADWCNRLDFFAAFHAGHEKCPATQARGQQNQKVIGGP